MANVDPGGYYCLKCHKWFYRGEVYWVIGLAFCSENCANEFFGKEAPRP